LTLSLWPLEAELIALLAECGFDEIEIPWRADVFRGAPQDKSSATFGTLGVNFRARKTLV
jgi:hypothetical protein